MGRIWPRADEWKLQWWELREFHTDSDDPEVLALVASLNDLQKGQARRIRVARRIGFWTVLPFLALTFYLMGLTEDGFLLRESLARAGEGIFLGITVALLVILARRWYLFREGEVIHLQERREHIFKELEDKPYRPPRELRATCQPGRTRGTGTGVALKTDSEDEPSRRRYVLRSHHPRVAMPQTCPLPPQVGQSPEPLQLLQMSNEPGGPAPSPPHSLHRPSPISRVKTLLLQS